MKTRLAAAACGLMACINIPFLPRPLNVFSTVLCNGLCLYHVYMAMYGEADE